MTAIPQNERRLIRASAGTGKTFQLTNRFLARLLDGVDPSQILAVTFTRNAAAEILDRVLVRLAAAATDPDKLAELAKALGRPDLDQDRCEQLLAQIIDHLQHIRVSTLDSYFSQVATSFCLELGLPLSWRILDRNQIPLVHRQAIRRLVNKGDGTVLRRLVNLLTGSDAGRSIEETLVRVVSKLYRVARGTPAEAWTWITPPARPSDAEWLEALEAFDEAPLPDDKRWTKAHQTSREAIVNREILPFVKAGIGANLACGKDTFSSKEISPEVAEAYLAVMEVASREVVNQLADQTTATRELLDLFDAEYNSLKREERLLEFDDITRALAGAALGENADRLAHRLNATVDHLLLDEFQDTSVLQWQVLEPLAVEITGEDQGEGRSFFCVGDSKQAIYGWRGGVAGIFGTLEEKLPGLKREVLATNRRSAPAVIETINQVFTRLDCHGELEALAECVHGWSAEFPEHKPHHVDRPGATCLRSVDGRGGVADQDSIADAIEAIVSESGGWEVGVLVRQNKTVASLVARLRQRGVAASEEGGFALTDSAPVLALLSLVRLADHPGDSLAAYHVATSPLGPVVGLSTETSPAERLEVSRRLRRELSGEGYGPRIGEWARAIAPAADQDERFRLSQFVRLATRFDRQATLRPADFDRFVRDERFGDPTSDRVRVMTIHQAKGLEFDIVVLPELGGSLAGRNGELVSSRPDPTSPPDRVCRTRSKEIQRLLPPQVEQVFRDDDGREAEESLCELYVAMTRPRYALHMLIAPSTKSESTLPATPAGLLRAALTNGDTVAADTVLWTHGNLNWFDQVEQPAEATAAEKPLDISLTPLKGPRRRGRQRLTPSGLEGHAEVQVASLFRAGSPTSLEHGTLVHAWFDAIDWLDVPPDDEQLRRIAVKEGLHPPDLDDQIASFRRYLDHAAVADLLKPTTYLVREQLPFDEPLAEQLLEAEIRSEPLNEYPFAIPHEGGVLRGSIDRLVLLWQGDTVLAADTIDFKTDGVSGDEEIAEKVEHYRGQLDAYRNAVGRLFALDSDRIVTRLVFLQPGQIVRV